MGFGEPPAAEEIRREDELVPGELRPESGDPLLVGRFTREDPGAPDARTSDSVFLISISDSRTSWYCSSSAERNRCSSPVRRTPSASCFDWNFSSLTASFRSLLRTSTSVFSSLMLLAIIRIMLSISFICPTSAATLLPTPGVVSPPPPLDFELVSRISIASSSSSSSVTAPSSLFELEFSPIGFGLLAAAGAGAAALGLGSGARCTNPDTFGGAEPVFATVIPFCGSFFAAPPNPKPPSPGRPTPGLQEVFHSGADGRMGVDAASLAMAAAGLRDRKSVV
jgi:hypothetical protein